MGHAQGTANWHSSRIIASLAAAHRQAAMDEDVADAEVEVTLERQAANAAPAADPALSQWKDWMRASQKNQKVGLCRLHRHAAGSRSCL